MQIFAISFREVSRGKISRGKEPGGVGEHVSKVKSPRLAGKSIQIRKYLKWNCCSEENVPSRNVRGGNGLNHIGLVRDVKGTLEII